MYKLLIVEDEIIIRKGIASSIDWNSLGFEIVGQVNNGQEGLDFILKNNVDAVLTDIRMPVMDGLKMSEMIHQIYPNIKIVILSGYADFSYAQQALHFTAFSYLLKPVEKAKLIKCFIDLKTYLDSVKQQHTMTMKYREIMKLQMRTLTERFIDELFNGKYLTETHIDDQLQFLELNIEGSSLISAIIRIDFPEGYIESTWNNNSDLIRNTYYNILDELADDYKHICYSITGIDHINLLLFYDNNDELTQTMNPFIKKIMTSISMLFSDIPSVSCGYGQAVENILQIPESFSQAKSAADRRFYAQQPFAMFQYDPAEVKNSYASIINSNDASLLFEAIFSGNSEKITSLTEEIFQRMREKQASTENIREYICYLCYTIQFNLADFNQKDIEIDLYGSYKRFCTDGASHANMQNALNQALIRAMETLSQSKCTQLSRDSIANIKKYIDQNYAQDISLEKLSREFYMSASYISYLFKASYGESYSDYLKQVRLTQAKSLIENNPNLKIYEICRLVGYKEYKYFSKQFKQAFGVTPSDIREAERSRE